MEIYQELEGKRSELPFQDFLRYALHRIALQATNKPTLNALEEEVFGRTGRMRTWICREHVPPKRALELEIETGITGLAALLKK